MPALHSRLAREARTFEAMIRLYCRDQHRSAEARAGLCPECHELLDYARQRLDKCPFGEAKTTCANCRIHCYKPAMRERVRVVMRYAGPRMLYRHPVLAVRHLLDGRKKEASRRPRLERGPVAEKAKSE